MGFTIRLAALLLLGVVASPAMATPPIIALDSGYPTGNSLGAPRTSRLHTINPATGAATLIGDTKACRGIGLARHANGELFALTSDETCASPSPVFPNHLLLLNHSTVAVAQVKSINSPALPGTFEGELAIDPGTGITYGIYPSAPPCDWGLYQLNRFAGSNLKIGCFPGRPGGQADLSAMAFSAGVGPGNLWVLDTDSPDPYLLRVWVNSSQVLAAYPISPTFPSVPPNGRVAGMDFDPDTGKLFVAAGNTLYSATVSSFFPSGTPITLTPVGPIGLPNGIGIVGMRFDRKEYCTLECGSRFCPANNPTGSAVARICNFSGVNKSYKYATFTQPTTSTNPVGCPGTSSLHDSNTLTTGYFGSGSVVVNNGTCVSKNVPLKHPAAMNTAGQSATYAMQTYSYVPGNPQTQVGPTLYCQARAVAVNPPCDIKKSLCSTSKGKCTSKMLKGLLQCHYKAEKSGAPVDGGCLQKALYKFDGGSDPTKGCFAKIEAKHGDECLTRDDSDTIEERVDDFVTDVVTAVDPSFPIPVQDRCSAGKKNCVTKVTAAVLKCHDKAEKAGVAVNSTCVQKAELKFDGGPNPERGCFARLEANGGCLTTDDSATVKTRIDGFVSDVLCELGYGTLSCPIPDPFPTEEPMPEETPYDVPTPTATPTDDPTPTATTTP